MESIISARLISKQQHGFLSRCSTETNLLESVNDWSIALNNKLGVLNAYTDFAKAFDVVKHNKLLHKMSAYGITSDLLKWIQSFLSGHSYCTHVNESYSQYLHILL